MAERRIGRHQRHVLDDRLRRKHAIERIAMRPRKEPGQATVLQCHGDREEIPIAENALQVVSDLLCLWPSAAP